MSLPIRGAWIEISTYELASKIDASLPIRGAWIEISHIIAIINIAPGRSPYGERGLKFYETPLKKWRGLSLPIRGAWIEMMQDTQVLEIRKSRSPYGERGLKYDAVRGKQPADGRSPYGERGLKFT